MPQNNLHLYTVIPETEFKAIQMSASHRKGQIEVVTDIRTHVVALRVGNVYYAQQFGTLEQSNAKYLEIKEGIRNGKIAAASSDR